MLDYDEIFHKLTGLQAARANAIANAEILKLKVEYAKMALESLQKEILPHFMHSLIDEALFTKDDYILCVKTSDIRNKIIEDRSIMISLASYDALTNV